MKAIPMTARRDGKRLSCVSPPWHLVSISYYQQVGLRLRWHLHGLVPHPIITIQQTQKPSVPVIVVLRSMSTSRWLLGLSVQSVEHENEQWISVSDLLQDLVNFRWQEVDYICRKEVEGIRAMQRFVYTSPVLHLEFQDDSLGEDRSFFAIRLRRP